MPTKKILGTFYPLKSEEWVETVKQLTHSELKILYYVRSLDPYNKGISLTPAQIAKDLSTEKSKMHRSTVGRALKSLDSKGFIQMELIQVRIQVNPKGFLSQVETEDVASTQPSCEQTTHVATGQLNVPEHNSKCNQTTECASTQQSKAGTPSQKEFETPKIYKTYIDFKKTLSEDESENFFRFVKEAIKNLKQPINDLEAWLASETRAGQKRWKVYYQNYQSKKKACKPKSETNLVSEGIKQKAIAKYQELLKQQKSECEKIEHCKRKKEDEDKLESLLNNPEFQIKSIEQLESHSGSTPKALGRYIAEGKGKLRNLRMANYFANREVRGGLA